MAKPTHSHGPVRYDKQNADAKAAPKATPPSSAGGGAGGEGTASAQTPPVQTPQQRRASYALQAVKEAVGADGKPPKAHVKPSEFKACAANLPAMIRMNGLGQAAAFAYSQNKDNDQTWKALYDILSDWLRQEKQPYAGKDLLTGITEGDQTVYRLAQVEALLLLDWVKQFAKACVRE